MTKGELFNALAGLPNDADVILYVREWGSTFDGDETYVGKYVELISVEKETNDYGETSIFLIGDND